MEFAPAGNQVTCEVTYDSPSLHVGMSVYNTSGGSPILVSGPTAMVNVVGNTYIGKFTPANNTQYLVFKAVYTSSGLTVLDDNYSQSSESVVGQDLNGGGSPITSNAVVGFVDNNNPVVGVVVC